MLCIKILGIREQENETTESLAEAIEEIAKLIGSDVKKEDVKETRRIGKKKQNGKTRSVVARIEKKDNLMAKKKDHLKDNEGIKASDKLNDKVLIFDDLTEARERLLRTVRDRENVHFAFVKDGYILARLQRGGKFIKIENAEDLFHVGVNDVDFADYYKSISRIA